MKFNTYMPKVLLIVFILLTLGYTMNAQDKVWNNKKCAVCLTYDDALNVHLDKVIPLLDSLGFKATFYVIGDAPGFKDRIKDWKKAAKKGNELGNHTINHPCQGEMPGREWVQPQNDLNHYTLQRMVSEIEKMNLILYGVDGKTVRTFAYPCGDTKVHDSSYIPAIKKDFIAARSVQTRMEKIDSVDLFDIGTYMINGQSGDYMIDLVKKAMDSNTLLVFLFHGVGGEHNINVSLDAHSKLLHFLKQNEKDIWVAPLVDIAKYIKDYDQKKK